MEAPKNQTLLCLKSLDPRVVQILSTNPVHMQFNAFLETPKEMTIDEFIPEYSGSNETLDEKQQIFYFRKFAGQQQEINSTHDRSSDGSGSKVSLKKQKSDEQEKKKSKKKKSKKKNKSSEEEVSEAVSEEYLNCAMEIFTKQSIVSTFYIIFYFQ